MKDILGFDIDRHKGMYEMVTSFITHRFPINSGCCRWKFFLCFNHSCSSFQIRVPSHV